MRGSCLCGKVHYQINGKARSVVACHCIQCRKTSGHHVAATQVEQLNLSVQGVEEITWYQSSETAERGFCRTCGSQLFWKEFASTRISVMAGTLDGETGLVMDRQLFTDSKGDYYRLPNVEPVDQSAL